MTIRAMHPIQAASFSQSAPRLFVALAQTTEEFVGTSDNTLGTLTATAVGAFAPDGLPAQVGDPVLVDKQSSGFQNGLYVFKVVGDGATQAVLQRHPEFNTAVNMLKNTIIKIVSGFTYLGREYRFFYSGSSFVVGTTTAQFLVQSLDTRSISRSPQAPGFFVADYASVVDFPSTFSTTTNRLTATAVGVLSIDGVALVAGKYVLLRAQTNTPDNGYYYVLSPGTAGTQAILYRITFLQQAEEIVGGDLFLVKYGSTLANTLWKMDGDVALTTVGTDNITYTQLI